MHCSVDGYRIGCSRLTSFVPIFDQANQRVEGFPYRVLLTRRHTVLQNKRGKSDLRTCQSLDISGRRSGGFSMHDIHWSLVAELRGHRLVQFPDSTVLEDVNTAVAELKVA